MMQSQQSDSAVGSIALGLALTAAMALGFFTFIFIGSFRPDLLAIPVVKSSTVTASFAAGLGLIAAAILLTGVYVRCADRMISSQERR
jgi:uncharacterized membrane protein (DUF485 family)